MAHSEYYKHSKTRQVYYVLACIVSLGVIPLVATWFPRIKARIAYKRMKDEEPLFLASIALVFQESEEPMTRLPHWNFWARLTDMFRPRGKWLLCDIRRLDLSGSSAGISSFVDETDWQQEEDLQLLLAKQTHPTNLIMYYEVTKQRFVYNLRSNTFEILPATLDGWNSSYSSSSAIDSVEAQRRWLVNGPNSVEHLVTPLRKVVWAKILTPFYVFQLFATVVWLVETYYTFALLILLMSTASVVLEIWMQRSNENRLRQIARIDTQVHVHRAAGVQVVRSELLVVGDYIQVVVGLVPADLTLVQGSCIVDEAGLTGEATPIVKHTGSAEKSARLLAGSRVLQVEADCRALVVATGFSTHKGALFRELWHPTPLRNQLEDSALPFLLLSIFVGLLGFAKRVFDGIQRGQPIGWLVLTSLDFITIAIPPALPIVLTVSNAASVTRLLRRGIYCVNPMRVGWSGGVDVVCWDKTGTLTESTVEIAQVVAKDSSKAALVMATAHGLAHLDDVLVGPLLDVEMFKSTGFVLLHPEPEQLFVKSVKEDKVWQLVKRWDFDSVFQRASSLVKGEDCLFVTVKGSPESIIDISTPESMLEWGGRAGLLQQVSNLGRQGSYVLALGMRAVSEEMDREEAESGLEFVGLLTMRNPIKAGVRQTMEEMRQAGIDNVMITGDGLDTAVAIAKQIGMLSNPVRVDGPLDELPGGDLVVTAAGLQWIMDSLNADSRHWSRGVIHQAKVFARAKPMAKTWLVRMLGQHKIVCMVGDGANDSGALHAAHVGIALSDAEASSVAGFTSMKQRVQDIAEIVREGRCALESAVSAMQFMLMYPTIQLTMAFYLQHINSNISQNQYFFDDLFLVLPTQLFLLSLGPRTTLTREKPPRTLFDVRVLVSLVIMVVIWLGMFAGVIVAMNSRSWFCPVSNPCYPINGNDDLRWGFVLRSMENTVAWTFGHFQFIIVGIVLMSIVGFRQSVWRELWTSTYVWFWWGYSWTWLLYVMAAWSLASLILFANESAVQMWPTFRWLFELREGVPLEFRAFLFGIAVLDLMLTVGMSWLAKRLLQKRKRKQMGI